MKSSTKYRIFLFLCLIMIMTLALLYAVYDVGLPKEKNSERTLHTQTVTQPAYWLKEKEGMVVIYHQDGETVYDGTGIIVKRLPPSLQKRIRQGYKIETYQKLIDFLENYSS
ncbi:hypothetical protein SAMN02910358_00203 [Lachnospiraceae bacterium XBB1006]|nr:hypothetical protein SAMN02910358_00203 [Lachnospiraceae bacterium XBB1006]